MMVWVLLPAFNEEKALPMMLPKLDKTFRALAQSYRVVVVNDGSRDRTESVASELQKSYPIDIFNHKINRGLGESERDGFEYIAHTCDAEDVVIRMDCDDTHEPQYIPQMLEQLKSGVDVVITSRFQKGGDQKGVNGYRSLISYAANLFMKTLFPISGVRDYSCGFRAYRASVLQSALKVFGNAFIQLKGLGFTSTLETIVKLKLLGCRFKEIPFVLRYDQKTSSSKMMSSLTIMGYLVMAILYHFPYKGWRSVYKGLAKMYVEGKDEALEAFQRHLVPKTFATRIGGG